MAFMLRNRWMGEVCKIGDPEDIQIKRISHKDHDAFLHTKSDQAVTRIAPPVWIWMDHTRMAGAWCIIATTHIEMADCQVHKDIDAQTGHVLVSTLKCCGAM